MNHPMRAYTIIVTLAVMLLAGCASSGGAGPAQAGFPQTLPTPLPGAAQLVVYYPYSFFWPDEIADVELGRKKPCALESGSFLIKDIQPQPQTTIVATLCGRLGTSVLKFKAEAGKTYYIRITPVNDNTIAGLIARRNLAEPEQQAQEQPASSAPSSKGRHKEQGTGKPSSKPIASSGGPFSIELIGESSALPEVKPLKACIACS